MSLDNSHIPPDDITPPEEPARPDDFEPGEIPVPPPPVPPPPPPVWSAPDDEPGWQVGEFAPYADYEKPKRKHGLGDEGRTFEWHEAWIAAVTQPSVATYEALIRDPRASFRRAALWIAALSLLGTLIQYSLMALFGLGAGDLGSIMSSTVMMVICAPVAAGVAIVALMIGWGLQYLAARLLGGTGTFEQHFYANSCYWSPMIIASLVGAVPCIGFLVMMGLGLYQMVLNVISVKAVHGFDWGRAFIATFWMLILVCGCMICSLMILGPAMTEVIQEAVETLYTPTP